MLAQKFQVQIEGNVAATIMNVLNSSWIWSLRWFNFSNLPLRLSVIVATTQTTAKDAIQELTLVVSEFPELYTSSPAEKQTDQWRENWCWISSESDDLDL